MYGHFFLDMQPHIIEEFESNYEALNIASAERQGSLLNFVTHQAAVKETKFAYRIVDILGIHKNIFFA